MQKLQITIIIFLIWSFSFAQQYTNYTTKNGLPSNHVYRITQDYKGFMWFLTDKGMVKYNGNQFKIFTTKEGLPANDVWDVRVGHDNKIWYFTKTTKLGYIENDSVYSFESTFKDEVLYPRVINQNKNEVFFSDYEKTFHLKDSLWSAQLDDIKRVNVINLSHQNVRGIILNENKKVIELFNHDNKVLKSFTNGYKPILNSKYRGQLNDSLFCFIGTKSIHLINLNTLKSITVKSPFGDKQLTRYSAVNNNIQFSGEDFVSFLNDKYQLTNSVEIPKKLNSHFSFVDKNKNLWIATFSNGICFLPYAKQKASYNLRQLKVGKLQKVKNDIIASVYKKGFYKYDTLQKKFKPFIAIDDFIYSATYIKELDAYYFLSDKTAIRIKNNEISKKLKYDNRDLARGLIYFKNALYGYTSFGINKINLKNFKPLKEYYQNGIRSVILFKEKLFIATGNGINQFFNDTITKVTFGNATFNKPTISLAKLNNEQLIVGTDGFGAYVTNLKTIKLLEHSNYLNVQQVIVKNNAIWLATNKGVWHYKKEANTIKLIKKYTTNDGLSTNQITNIFITDDSILASSNDGVSTIPITNKDNNQFLSIYFDEVKYNNKPIKNQQVKYTKDNHLQVKIASINYFNEKNETVDYQLFPVQKNWITTTSKQISFNNLPPNKYQFNIKSNRKENSLKFEILPLWHQTLLAKTVFLSIGLVLFLGALYYFRKKELAKQTKKLNAQKKLADFELHALRSQMNPHFVFNSLNAIQYFITKNESDLSEKYLVKFSRLIRMFFDFSREKELLLQEEIDLLKGYLEIEKMRFGSDFKYQFNIDEKLDLKRTKIPSMLLQPIVENAVNHGIFHNKGKGTITISFIFINVNTYKVSIIDDGVGIKKSQEIQSKSFKKHNSKSTIIFKERIELLNSAKRWNVKYKIIEENGTKVYLTFTQYG